MRNRLRHRRGVLLLVVIGLLALFMLTATTFVVTSGHYRRGTSALADVERHHLEPRPLLDAALERLVRGLERDSDAPLARHSLLEDLYGQDGLRGTLSAGGFSSAAGGQLAQLTVENLSVPAVSTVNHYSGSVATVISAASGETATARIVGSQDAGLGNLQLATESFGTMTPGEGDLVIVNGRPFDGAGAGFDAAAQAIEKHHTFNLKGEEDGGDDQETDDGTTPVRVAAALLGNYGPFTVDGPDPTKTVAERSFDESYDAADFQNMFLSWTASSAHQDVIPSFHRPSVVQHLQALANANGVRFDLSVDDSGNDRFYDARNDVELDRLVTSAIFRPTKIHHPHFDGGNEKSDLALGFDPTNGPWDVDNDGNGVADSVWIDLGSPWVSDGRGRKYKPLYAIHCIDLDGRLNLNAHGSEASTAFTMSVPSNGDVAGAGFGNAAATMRGNGHGPAEVSLPAMIGGNVLDANTIVATRQRDPGSTSLGAGQTGLDENGSDRDAHSYENIGYPATHYLADLCSFMSPLDLYGQTVTVLDHLGQPLVFPANSSLAARTIDDPYEVNLGSPDGHDSPFGPSDLEALLRLYDIDVEATTSPRLRAALPEGGLEAGRQVFTTNSFDVPIPNDLGNLKTAFDTDPAMMPFELALGTRMDLNRPFGDGNDDNGNGVVDEPGENGALAGQSADLLRGDRWLTANDGTAARQLFARHLYCMLMFLNGHNDLFTEGIDLDGDAINDLTASERTAMMLAQWAINVVDFRDADSIMTPFEFDLVPSNGWDADGDLTTQDNVDETFVVWGCERPELLITETLAWHDRRTEDLEGFVERDGSTENQRLPDPNAPVGFGGPEPDEEPDQRLRPRGACFIEIYNPWSSQALRAPAEFYTAGPNGGVDLSALAESESPVWRLYINEKTLADPDAANRNDDGTLELAGDNRLVYFVTPGENRNPRTAPGPDRQAFYSTLHTSSVIRPNHYAVVGSAGTHLPGTNRYVSMVGFPSAMKFSHDATQQLPSLTSAEYEQMQRVELVVEAGSEQVRIRGFGQDDPIAGVNPATAFVVDQTVDGNLVTSGSLASFSISEPLAGSPQRYPRAQTTASFMEPRIKASDNVLDSLFDDLSETRTHSRYRIVHLQRLANPLRAYHSVTNPYRTIDSAFIDLTSFNGVTKQDNGWKDGTYQPAGSVKDIRFYSNQRGDAADASVQSYSPGAAADRAPRNLWRREVATNTGLAGNSQRGNGVSIFDFALRQTLGYLNHGYGPRLQNDPTGTNNLYVGAPNAEPGNGQPFPWLTWNNRPFATAAELLNVPRTSSARLTEAFSVESGGGNYFSWGSHPFQHLLNFTANDVVAGQRPQLHRLFEFVTVPSRFRGDRRWFNPTSGNNTDPVQLAKPPFNALSRFRDPGKVNLNTIGDELVWENLVAGTAASDVSFEDFRRARGDSYDAINSRFALHPTLPTRFTNPFCAFGAARLVPKIHPALGTLARSSETEATLFRRGVGTDGSRSDFPLLIGATSQPHNNAARNPYFAHQALQRLQSVTTNHSNVYAVWITVGFFEGETWTTDPADDNHGVFDKIARYQPEGEPDRDVAHPEGLMLGRELGWDEGDIHRHRAFYIIDRSIPVAFEPGQNHNAMDTVVLQRFIE